jgi:hypothetical protein
VYGLCSRIGAAVKAGTHHRPDGVKLFTAAPVPADLGSHLPDQTEKDFSTYAARISSALGKDWSFVLNSAQAVSPELYRHARDLALVSLEAGAVLDLGPWMAPSGPVGDTVALLDAVYTASAVDVC